MGAEIKDMFFTDKLRSIVSTLFMLILIALVGLTWAFPRQTSSNLDEKSLSTLQEVSKQLKNAADNFERQANESVQLRETLSRTYDLQKGDRDDVYDEIMRRYGLDPAKMEVKGKGYAGNSPPSTIINVGVLPPDDSKRSSDVPASSGNPGRDRQLPHAAGKNSGGSDSGDAPAPKGGTESPH
jgi:hypothetical protein